MVFIAMLAFMSCSDDDAKDVDSKISGDWALMNISDDGTNLYMERLNLKSSGSFTITIYDAYGQSLNNGGSITNMDRSEYSGTYTATDGQLKLSANGQSVTYSYKVSSNTLTLTTSEGLIVYDKVDSDIKEVFSKADQWYNQHH